MTALSTSAREGRNHVDVLLIPQPAFPRCAESAEIRMSENMLMIIVGAAAGGLLILMLVTIIVVTCHHKRKNKRLEKELTEKKYASTPFEHDKMR